MEQMHRLWRDRRNGLNWDCLFATPFWLETVVGHLGIQGEPLILTVECDGQVVGVAPLARIGDAVSFLGIADVCDYQDIITIPGREADVGRHLMEYLSKQGIGKMDLETLRPDAALFKALAPLEEASATHVRRVPVEVTYETALPGDWETYLMSLSGKQRHEVRRKVRRLDAHGPYRFRMAGGAEVLDDEIAGFLRLFQLNRTDKADFMDQAMAAFFKALMAKLQDHQMLRLYFLELDGLPAATVLCFDYAGTRYLYNSGYDARYTDLSVGILSKVFSIQKGINAGCRTYDFLKGAETYKKRIGGHEVPLYRCRVAL